MSRRIYLIVMALSIGLAGSTFAGSYGGGSGTAEDPYQISLPEHLDDMHYQTEDYDKYFVLGADIDMEDYHYGSAVIAYDESIWSGYTGTEFSGVFDGRDYKITNLVVRNEHYYLYDYLGLFGKTGPDAIVKNLHLEIITSGEFRVGGVAGSNSGLIENCHIIASILCRGAGGGLAGVNTQTGAVKSSTSRGEINANAEGASFGGLVGYNKGNVFYCYSSADIIAAEPNDAYLGGLVGNNNGTIENSYSTGLIEITDINVFLFGGLSGLNEGIINNCYTTGDILYFGSFITSMIGQDSGIVNNCYDKTTSQLKRQSTFSDWDFINVWGIGEGQTYPYLRTVPSSDINKDKVVNLLDFSIIAEQWMREE